uniref:Uncharacterized protein n=1 Tax=Setaria viridis TaxID=4556 RepID=A0A4U6TRH3_SETVI|nr:hypothetical protein SEVIR_8G090050v2 [Setaria viridis]
MVAIAIRFSALWSSTAELRAGEGLGAGSTSAPPKSSSIPHPTAKSTGSPRNQTPMPGNRASGHRSGRLDAHPDPAMRVQLQITAAVEGGREVLWCVD